VFDATMERSITLIERDERRSKKPTGFEGRGVGSQDLTPRSSNSLPGGHSEREPPDPIPNSEVKTLCADGSVPFRHARVGHCQALKMETPEVARLRGFFICNRLGSTGQPPCIARERERSDNPRPLRRKC